MLALAQPGGFARQAAKADASVGARKRSVPPPSQAVVEAWVGPRGHARDASDAEGPEGGGDAHAPAGS